MEAALGAHSSPIISISQAEVCQRCGRSVGVYNRYRHIDGFIVCRECLEEEGGR